MLWSLASTRITITRRSAWVVEAAAAAATLTVLAQPSRPSRIEVSVSSGTANTGSVFATGLAAGLTTTEEIVFDGTLPVRQTSAIFTSISGMTSSGLADEASPPTVAARAIGLDGSPQQGNTVVVAGWPASIAPESPSWSNGLAGRTQDGTTTMLIPWTDTFTPRTGDRITDDLGQVWDVLGVPRPGGFNVAQQWVVKVRRFEG